MPAPLARLSLNQMTVNQWNVREAVEACVRHKVPEIGLWRHKIAESGIAEAARIVRENGIRVSSLCRGGMFPAATAAERQERIDDNRRAIDEARELGTSTLVLVCGAAPDRDIDAARRMVHEGIAAVVDHAAASGVQLGIEPLHPMFAADRSVIVSLRESIDLAEKFEAKHVGVVIDVYHVWWDVDLYEQILRAHGRILSFHVNDWIVPPPDHLKGRGMMGDGTIEIQRMRHAVEAAGYSGPIEVEIFNQAVWDSPGDDVMKQMVDRYLALV
jgi:sugar phosphate isomerase/epimerase